MDLSPSLFRPGRNCAAVGTARRVALLVDGETYFDAFVRATARAERSIVIVGWDFDSRTVLRHDAHGHPEVILGEYLNHLAHANRGLEIRILDWDYPMIFGTDREFPPIYGITWKPHRRIDFRYDDTHPLAGSHHQKIVVIDDRFAFAGGLDLTGKRWDSSHHRPDDPRRVFNGEPYPPMHDMMVAVDGDAAHALADTVRARWYAATGERLDRVHVAGDPWPPDLPVEMTDVCAAISTTAPPGSKGASAVRQVERLYLDMIERARRSIYIENQYFTSELIAQALATRLREPDGPEIVLVTRLLSHGWLEEMTMHVLRTGLVEKLRAADARGRFHVYYPHIDGLAHGTCIDLHSKVMVIDDEWLRIGSSNLSNRSMGMDTECDVTFEARGDERIRTVVRHFRDRLLAEHLAVATGDVQREIAARGTMGAAIAALAVHPRRLLELDSPVASEPQRTLAAIGDLEKPLPLEAIVQPLSAAPAAPRPPGLRLVVLLCVLALALALAWSYSPLADLVTRHRLVEWGRDFARSGWAPLVIVLAYTPATFTMFPRWLITMVAVLAFGPWMGFLYGLLGMLIAGVCSFLPGRLVRRDTVRRLAGPRLASVMALLHRKGALSVAIVRLLPVAPYAVVNLVMGAMRIRLRDFVVGSAIGIVPGMLFATTLSEQIALAINEPTRINGWFAAAGVLGLAALAYFGQRALRRMRSPRHAQA